MQKRSSDKVSIRDGDLVKVKQMNHMVHVRHSSKANYKPNIKKLDADRYIEIGTGEIKEFNHIENRSQSYNSLRQTFKKISDFINNNFAGKGNELHVTLTYKSNMTDTEQLYNDFKRFFTRLKRKYQKETTIDYINIVEPQGRGAWHCHVLLRFNDLDTIFIKNSELRALWGLGFVKIKSLKEVDNIGAYLSAYLADVELTEENVGQVLKGAQIVEKDVEGQKKRFIKGGRLHMYPPGMNLYRKSKGIIPPVEEEMSFRRVKKIVGAVTPHYQKSITLQDDENEITHQYVQYNTKRHQNGTD